MSNDYTESSASPAYLSELHTLIHSSDVILLETSAVLHPGFEPMLSDLILVLSQCKKHLTLLPDTISCLMQFASCPEESPNLQALRILDVLWILRDHNILHVHDHTGQPIPCDGEALHWILEQLRDQSVLLLTQSPGLAADCASLSSLHTRGITVRRIAGPHGRLDAFARTG